MYQESIARCFSETPPYPVNQIEAGMRVLRHDGCLDSVTPRQFLRLAFDACRELATFSSDDERAQFAATFGL